MSDNKRPTPQNDEIDLGQLFNGISQMFKAFFNLLKNIFNAIFRFVIYALKPFVNNILKILLSLIIAAVIGYFYEKTTEPTYASDMLVRPYFDSKYQLVNNIDYFNALIEENNVKELSSIFEIDSAKK